jgi:phosphoglycerate dehydrogenase-like enzyme
MKTLALDLNDRLQRAKLPVDPILDMTYADLAPLKELAPVLGEAVGLMTNPRVPINDEFLDFAPNLQMVQLSSAGYERVDMEATKRRSVIVANASGTNAASVAEWVYMMTMGLQRQLLANHQGLQDGRYQEVKLQQQEQGLSELSEKTIGIVGFGRIGREVAKRAIGFGLKTLYYDIVRPTAEEEAQYQVTYTDLFDLLRSSDIVTVHVPLNASTYHLIGEEELSALKPTALVVNAARGPLVDPAPLATMIADGRVGGAAIDVFETEPAPNDDPMMKLAATGHPRLLVSPHMAGVTVEAQRRALEYSLANLARYARGETPLNICD